MLGGHGDDDLCLEVEHSTLEEVLDHSSTGEACGVCDVLEGEGLCSLHKRGVLETMRHTDDGADTRRAPHATVARMRGWRGHS